MSDLRPRHCTDPEIHGPHTYADDADMRPCPGSSVDETLTRIRDDLAAELDDQDPDHTMRQGHADGADQGHPGNSWWRAYCECGGMLRALAVIDHARSSNE